MTQPFATILRRALDERDIRASDLARRIWGSDGKGGARNRQVIGQYLTGRVRPKLAMVERIAVALQMPPGELLPDFAPVDKVSVEAGVEDDTVMLRINRRVDSETAMKIIGILSAA